MNDNRREELNFLILFLSLLCSSAILILLAANFAYNSSKKEFLEYEKCVKNIGNLGEKINCGNNPKQRYYK